MKLKSLQMCVWIIVVLAVVFVDFEKVCDGFKAWCQLSCQRIEGIK